MDGEDLVFSFNVIPSNAPAEEDVRKGFGKDFVLLGAFSAILNARLGNGFVGVTGLFVLLQYLLCVSIKILLSS